MSVTQKTILVTFWSLLNSGHFLEPQQTEIQSVAAQCGDGGIRTLVQTSRLLAFYMLSSDLVFEC